MHCVCCPIALVSLERNSGERKRDAGVKKKGGKMRESCERHRGQRVVGARLEQTNATRKPHRAGERTNEQERQNIERARARVQKSKRGRAA